MNNRLKLVLKLIDIKDELENIGEWELKLELESIIKRLEKVKE